MCVDGVSSLLFTNEAIMEKLANPILDFVHKQVLMALYSWDSAGTLGEFRELLPVYLSKDRQECDAILRTVQEAGLVTLSANGIALVHPLPKPDAHCNCSSPVFDR